MCKIMLSNPKFLKPYSVSDFRSPNFIGCYTILLPTWCGIECYNLSIPLNVWRPSPVTLTTDQVLPLAGIAGQQVIWDHREPISGNSTLVTQGTRPLPFRISFVFPNLCRASPHTLMTHVQMADDGFVPHEFPWMVIVLMKIMCLHLYNSRHLPFHCNTLVLEGLF